MRVLLISQPNEANHLFGMAHCDASALALYTVYMLLAMMVVNPLNVHGSPQQANCTIRTVLIGSPAWTGDAHFSSTAVDPLHQLLYATSRSSSSVSAVHVNRTDGTSGETTAPVVLSCAQPQTIRASAGGVTTAACYDAVYLINGFQVKLAAGGLSGVRDAAAYAVTSSNATIYAASWDNGILAIDTGTQTVRQLTYYAQCQHPMQVVNNPVNGRLYAACGNGIVVIDGVNVYAPLSGPGTDCIYPSALTVNEATGQAYAMCDGNLVSIDDTTRTFTRLVNGCGGSTLGDSIGIDSTRNVLYLPCSSGIVALRLNDSKLFSITDGAQCPFVQSVSVNSLSGFVYAACRTATASVIAIHVEFPPIVTPNLGASSSSSTGSRGNATNSVTSSASSGPNMAAIVGGCLGAVAFLLVLFALWKYRVSIHSIIHNPLILSEHVSPPKTKERTGERASWCPPPEVNNGTAQGEPDEPGSNAPAITIDHLELTLIAPSAPPAEGSVFQGKVPPSTSILPAFTLVGDSPSAPRPTPGQTSKADVSNSSALPSEATQLPVITSEPTNAPSKAEGFSESIAVDPELSSSPSAPTMELPVAEAVSIPACKIHPAPIVHDEQNPGGQTCQTIHLKYEESTGLVANPKPEPLDHSASLFARNERNARTSPERNPCGGNYQTSNDERTSKQALQRLAATAALPGSKRKEDIVIASPALPMHRVTRRLLPSADEGSIERSTHVAPVSEDPQLSLRRVILALQYVH
jgi:hypothetical protein